VTPSLPALDRFHSDERPSPDWHEAICIVAR